MKHLNHIFAFMMLALAACANDDVINTTDTDPNEIRLSVTTNMPTVVTSRNWHSSASALTKNFQVFAVKTSTAQSSAFDSYIDNETVTHADDGSWSFSLGKHYWPGEKLNFYAFHFASSDDTEHYEYYTNKYDSPELVYNEDKKCVGVQVKNVSMPTTSDLINTNYSGVARLTHYLNDDMLYAVTKEQQNDDTNSGTVSLNFRHALSAIHFATSTRTPSLYVDLAFRGIKICGFQNKGDVFFGADETSTNFADGNNEAYGYSSQCSWTTHDDNAADNYSCFAYAHMALFKDLTVKSTSSSTVSMSSSLTEDPSKPLMLIPQKYTEGKYENGAWSGVYMRISCMAFFIGDLNDLYSYSKTITKANAVKGDLTSAILSGTTAHPNPYGVMIFGDPNSSDHYKDLYIKIPEIKDADGNNVGWEPGKAYVYNLIWDVNSDDVNAYNADGTPAMVGIQLKVDKIDQWNADSDDSTNTINAGANQ